MKKSIYLFALSSLSTLTLFSQSTNPSPYCAAGYDDGFMSVDHHISNVSIGSLSNNSGSTQYTGQHYVYYNNISAPTLSKGGTYTLSVSHDGGSSIHFLAAYIDFNNDGDFSDAGERVLQKTINDATQIPNPAVVSVTIPANASIGNTRMRVMVFEDDEYTWAENNTNATPCTADASGSLDWGETEDYMINITGTVTGINELNHHTTTIKAYPVPVTDNLTIETNDQQTIHKIIILNINGQIVQEFIIDKPSQCIDFSTVPNGLYTIEVFTNQSISRFKISK